MFYRVTGNSRRQPLRAELTGVARTPDPPPTTVPHVGANHRRAHIVVPDPLRHRAKVVTALHHVCCKGMPKRMAERRLCNPDAAHRTFQRPLRSVQPRQPDFEHLPVQEQQRADEDDEARYLTYIGALCADRVQLVSDTRTYPIGLAGSLSQNHDPRLAKRRLIPADSQRVACDSRRKMTRLMRRITRRPLVRRLLVRRSRITLATSPLREVRQ